ncbi:MAG: CBS domain-containing protein [Rhodospirillales bacterium]|jgi:CBS domain-containing protein
MSVATILKRKPPTIVTIEETASVADAAQRLAQHRIGALPVMGAGGRLAGILSERDVVRGVATKGAAALSEPVSALMTAGVETTTEVESIGDVMQRMTKGRFRHMPVLKDGRLIGMISIGDVVKHRIDEQELEVETLRGFVTGMG